jgi:hypothetical protein
VKEKVPSADRDARAAHLNRWASAVLNQSARLPLVALLLLPLVAVPGQPKPTKTQYFETTYAGFVILYPSPETKYDLSLSVADELPRPAFLQVIYENPENPDEPDLQIAVVDAGQSEVHLESRVLKGFKNRKKYTVVVEIYSDKRMKTKAGEHIQVLQYIAIPDDVLSR